VGNTEYPVATDEIAHQFRESAMSILLSITADRGRALWTDTPVPRAPAEKLLSCRQEMFL